MQSVSLFCCATTWFEKSLIEAVFCCRKKLHIYAISVSVRGGCWGFSWSTHDRKTKSFGTKHDAVMPWQIWLELVSIERRPSHTRCPLIIRNNLTENKNVEISGVRCTLQKPPSSRKQQNRITWPDIPLRHLPKPHKQWARETGTQSKNPKKGLPHPDHTTPG